MLATHVVEEACKSVTVSNTVCPRLVVLAFLVAVLVVSISVAYSKNMAVFSE